MPINLSQSKSACLFVPGLFQTSRDICCVVFALFNVVWATLFLERWKRRGAELAYKWGTLDTPAESLEEPRPQFRVRDTETPTRSIFPSSSFPLSGSFTLALFLQGVKRCSPITGCEEFYYPPWRRRVFRWLVSLPICILCLCFVFLVMLICFELQVSQLSNVGPRLNTAARTASMMFSRLCLCRSLWWGSRKCLG